MKRNAATAWLASGFLSLGLFSGAHPALADSAGIVKLPQDIAFTNAGASAEVAVLYGDPAKPGLYVTRVRLAPGAKVGPHVHPEEARTVTILSGTLYFGFGDQWDEAKLTPYPAGTFYTEPQNIPHFVAAKDGEVVFQVAGIGPSGLKPAQPSPK